MKVFRHIEDYGISQSKSPIVLTIGNYDGVHLGHQEVIKETIRQGKLNKLNTCVLTFDPHPKKVLFNRDFRVIQELEEKCNILALMKIDILINHQFDKAFATLTSDEFVTEVLKKKLNAKHVVIGEDFSCGADSTGNVDDLKITFKNHGITLTVIPPHVHNRREVHSTMIRDMIQDGRIELANEFLFSTYCLSGQVKHGRQKGREIGFPTINFSDVEKVIPSKGVYFTRALVDGKYYDSVSNIGTCPTFVGAEVGIETHILDFNDDVYGKHISVYFYKKHREEKTFGDISDLAEQIEKDVEARRAYKIS
jgi:riboflavin kinase/FMN adenylyltransferase